MGKTVIPCLATAMRSLQHSQEFSEAHITQWLDTFLLSRIGTEMLTSQYIACAVPTPGEKKSRQGIVDADCDPARICEQAAMHAKTLVKQHFSANTDVQIKVLSCGDKGSSGRIRFPYVPQYLFYIMVELLKN